MKTLKISDEAHAKLTSIVGRLMAETGKMKTYSDAIEAMLSRSVIMSTELLGNIETFVRSNPQLGLFYERRIHTRYSAPEAIV